MMYHFYDFLHKPASVTKQLLQYFTGSTDFIPVEAVELFVSSVLGRFTLENSLSIIKKIRKRLKQQCSHYDFKQVSSSKDVCVCVWGGGGGGKCNIRDAIVVENMVCSVASKAA